MKKKLTIVVFTLCFSLVFCACTNKKNGLFGMSTAEKDAMQYKLNQLDPSAYNSIDGLSLEPGSYISIIGRYSNDSYWKQVETGAQQAVDDLNEKLGYTGSDKIQLSFTAPIGEDDIDDQISILDEELARYPVAVAIATIDPEACMFQFELAAEDNIPIVTFDSGNNYPNITTHISTDNTAAAKTAATKLADSLGGAGEIVIFAQDSVSTSSQSRVQSFRETIVSDYPNVSIANTYYLDRFDETINTIASERGVDPETISQEEVVEYLLEKHPNLSGIYTTSLTTTQMVAKVLVDTEKENLKFVGFDGGKEQISLLEDGILDGIIVQNPFGMGYAAVVAAARVSLGLPNDSSVNSGYVWVTKDNLEDDKVKNMLY